MCAMDTTAHELHLLSSHISWNNDFMQIQSNATRYQVGTRFPQYMIVTWDLLCYANEVVM